MAKRHMPLRPAPPREARPNPESTSGELETKRRRVVVSVACDTCRRKKTRCDGGRPSCATCRAHSLTCVYRDNNLIAPQAGKLLLEVIGLLNNMPAQEAVRVIRQLHDESDARVIISILRGGMDGKQRPSDLSTAVTILGDSSLTLEMAAHFPAAYPRLPRIPVDALREGLYNELTRPSSGGPPTRQSSPRLRLRGQAVPGQRHQSDDDLASQELCDPRLHNLNIAHWTDVPISNEVAARAISLYLKTDHPLLCHFDPELFVTDLVTLQDRFCSSLLVNALLFWACMYSTIDQAVEALPLKFCEEAERLIDSQHGHPTADSELNLAALQFLSLGYLGQGRDHAVLKYLKDAVQMGERMGLFGVDDDRAILMMDKMTSDEAKNFLCVAWGVFNWITLMSVFYHQPGIECPRYAPRLPIPESRSVSDYPRAAKNMDEVSSLDVGQLLSGPSCMVFPHLCRFWRIMHEVALVYYSKEAPLPDYMSALRFSEYKFRELLTWSSSLPSALLRKENSPHYVQILHIWFHAAVLDLFRPYIKSAGHAKQSLGTFPSSISSPDIIYASSVNQLELLVIDYRLNYRSSTYTILWHTALIYVANAVLQEKNAEGWLFFFLLCVYGYERLRRSWRVTEAITAGLLSMTLRKGDIPSHMARKIMNDLQQRSLGHLPGRIRATFMVDLDLAMSNPEEAKAETLADNFEDYALFGEYTNEFDNPQN